MRLPYAPNTPSPADNDIYTRIAEWHHPHPLIPLDLTLLHSPLLADSWNSFIGAIQSSTQLNQGLLEMAVSQVAVLTDAVYEWNVHAPLALKGGIKSDTLHAVHSVPCTASAAGEGEKELEESVLSGLQRVVVQYMDQMTVRVKVDDEVFAYLKHEGLSDCEVVELTTRVAGYNYVSQVLVALDVGENNG